EHHRAAAQRIVGESVAGPGRRIDEVAPLRLPSKNRCREQRCERCGEQECETRPRTRGGCGDHGLHVDLENRLPHDTRNSMAPARGFGKWRRPRTPMMGFRWFLTDVPSDRRARVVCELLAGPCPLESRIP